MSEQDIFGSDVIGSDEEDFGAFSSEIFGAETYDTAAENRARAARLRAMAQRGKRRMPSGGDAGGPSSGGAGNPRATYLAPVYVTGDEEIGGLEAEIFGATVPEAGGGPFVTIHFKQEDIPAIVKAQAGSIGGLMAGLLPNTITAKVYEGTAKQIADGMKAKNINADVRVVSTRPFGGPFKQDFLIGAGVGVGAVGVVYGLVKLIKHFIGRK
jgi:hypothetical protein